MDIKKNDKQNTRQNNLHLVVILSILCCILMYFMMTVYEVSVQETLAKIQEKGKMAETEWFVRYASLVPPVIILAIVITVCYKLWGAYVPVTTQREKATIVLIAFIFTNVVLFFSCMSSSPEWNVPKATDEAKTAFEICAPWFFAQILPFTILLSYHLIRASSEKKELSENEE